MPPTGRRNFGHIFRRSQTNAQAVYAITPAGGLPPAVSDSGTGSFSLSATGSGVYPQSAAATTSLTVALTRRAGKVVAATTSLTVALTRRVGKAMAATTSLTATLNRLITKRVGATTTLVPTLVVGEGEGATATMIFGASGTETVADAGTATFALDLIKFIPPEPPFIHVGGWVPRRRRYYVPPSRKTTAKPFKAPAPVMFVLAPVKASGFVSITIGNAGAPSVGDSGRNVGECSGTGSAAIFDSGETRAHLGAYAAFWGASERWFASLVLDAVATESLAASGGFTIRPRISGVQRAEFADDEEVLMLLLSGVP